MSVDDWRDLGVLRLGMLGLGVTVGERFFKDIGGDRERYLRVELLSWWMSFRKFCAGVELNGLLNIIVWEL